MKIIFWGSDDFAFPLLAEIQKYHEICLVICQSDKESGRNRKLTPPPAKVWALERKIPVEQPESLKNNQSLLNLLRESNPDLFLVVSYGKIIPANFLIIPPKGAINIHASLLPKLRGASPMQSALMQGLTKTGISIQYMTSKMDAGDIIASREIGIQDDWDYGKLKAELALLSSQLLPEVLHNIKNGKVMVEPQDEGEATFCYKLTPVQSIINWHSRTQEIHNLIRAFSPYLGARTWYKGKLIKLWNARMAREEANSAGIEEKTLDFSKFQPGEIALARKGKLLVATTDSFLEIVKLQPENKKIMNAQDFINGFRPEVRSSFSSKDDI